MISEGFGQLGKFFFSARAAASNLAGLQSIYAHCFPDGRTRNEGFTAGWAGIFSVIWAWGNLEGRLSLLAGWLVASHRALGLEIEKSVTSSVWPLGTLQNLRSLGVAVQKCPVSHGCSVLMGRTRLQASAFCFFIPFSLV